MSSVIENLPNVCIKNIFLDSFQESSSKYKITVEVAVKHGLNISGNVSWLDDDFLTKHMNIVVIKSSSDSFNKGFTNGTVALDNNVMSDHSTIPKDIQMKKISFVSQKKSDDMGETICKFEFSQDHQTDSLFLFAMTEINISNLAAMHNSDLLSDSFKYYYGPITSESIIKNGEIVTEANLLTDGSNEAYYGPVHFHESKGYMVGSKHSPQPHSKLTVVKVPNLKLKDNRMVKHSSVNTVFDLADPQPVVSELYTTFDEGNVLKGFFSIDIGTLLLKKTKYRKSFLNLGEDIRRNLLSSFSIKSIKLYKNRVSISKTKKITKVLSRELLARTKDEKGKAALANRVRMKSRSSHGHNDIFDIDLSDFNLENKTFVVGGETKSLNDYRHISSIAEESVFGNNIRSFSFIDGNLKSNKSMNYAYSVEVVFSDPSIKIIEDIILEIDNSVKNLQQYINNSLLTKNYDFKTGKMKQGYIEALRARYSVSLSPWIRPCDVYAKYFSLLSNITVEQQRNMAIKYSSFLDPKSFSSKSAKIFLYKFKELSSALRNHFRISGDRIQSKVAGRSQGVYQNSNAYNIEVNHDFKEVLNYSSVNRGYQINNAPNINPNGLYTITIEEFRERIKTESNKYFDGAIELTKEEISSLSKPEYIEFKETNLYAPSYLSPMSVNTAGQKMDLSNPSKINHIGLANSVTMVNKNSVVNVKDFTLEKLSLDGIKRKKTVQQNESSLYLGNSSQFVSGSIEEEASEPSFYNKFPSQPNRMLVAKNSALSIKNFDILRNIKIPNELPNQIKSIVGSRSSGAKNSFLNADVDVLKLPETANSMEILFFSLQRVMYLESYQERIKRPVWKVLDANAIQELSGNVLCRMEYYNPSGLKISLSDENKLNVYNRIFIISFPPVSRAREKIPNPDLLSGFLEARKALGDNNVDYTTTNIMVQPENRSGINSDFNYSKVNTSRRGPETSPGSASSRAPTAANTGGSNYGY